MTSLFTPPCPVGKSISFAARPDAAKSVGLWLSVCALMVFVMIVLGGLTRLTESGLSMVKWQLLHILPPLTLGEWQQAFLDYQSSPEYRLVNHGMSLEEFKSIFWLEYLHRLWGRLIGVVFFIPWLVFVIRGMISRSLALYCLGIFALGGLQGVIGWVMVQSGLSEIPQVSPVRLALHLGLAVVILALLLWRALSLLSPDLEYKRPSANPTSSLVAWKIALAWLFVTMMAGALVAGHDAGLIYPTFPLMDGALIPDHLIYQTGAADMLNDVATVQFNHRLAAMMSMIAILGVFIAGPKPLAAKLAAGMAILQAGLGIATLSFGVPIALASLHQAGAVILFCLILWTIHTLTPYSRGRILR